MGWVRPADAAAGVLDDEPLDLWPRLAARWLAAGFDSEPLRQLAGLRCDESHAALDLMPVALRSIGFDPSAADAEFVARCQAALDVVQRTWTPPGTASTGCARHAQGGGRCRSSRRCLMAPIGPEDGA